MQLAAIKILKGFLLISENEIV